MNTLLRLSLLFFVGCTLGWVLELFFRRIVHKKWINPGFLTGPYLPLYGFGLVGLYLVCSIDYSFIESKWVRDIFVVLLITFLMTLLEYITGLIFIKGLKVKLWDYSDRWGNIQGIICPAFTCAWGAIGAVYYFFIHGPVLHLLNWFTNNLAFSFVVGMFYGVFAVDFCYSFNIANKIRAFAKEKNLVVKYETLKHTIREKTESIKHNSFIFAFLSKNFEDDLGRYYMLHANDQMGTYMQKKSAKKLKKLERKQKKEARSKKKNL